MRLLMFFSLCMINVTAKIDDNNTGVTTDDNLPHKSCTDNIGDDSRTCVEYNTKTLENIYPTVVSIPNNNNDIKNSVNKLSVLSLIAYLLI